jgi:hypothetical protein
MCLTQASRQGQRRAGQRCQLPLLLACQVPEGQGVPQGLQQDGRGSR